MTHTNISKNEENPRWSSGKIFENLLILYGMTPLITTEVQFIFPMALLEIKGYMQIITSLGTLNA